jgi:sulfonate transport system substrate-binding protein
MTTDIRPTRRDTLRWLAAGAATAAAPFAHASAPAPKAIRLAGGASYKDGKLQLGGYARIITEQGWLEQQLTARGIKLEWFGTAHAATGPMINEAFANRSVDFAGYGDLPSVILNSGGVSTRIVVPHGLGSGDGYLVVPAGSTARTIEDLKGKKLAVHRGRPWEMPLVRLIQAKGLTYGDFHLFNINPQAGMAAIASGQVDALFTMTDAYLLEDKGVGRIIWSTKEAAVDWKYRTDFFGSKAFIDTHPELTQLVVTAYVKAAHWASLAENTETILEMQAANGTPISVVRRNYADRDYAWKDRWSPLYNDVVLRHYRQTIDFAVQQKMIRRPIDAEALLDRRFATAALKSLGLTSHWQPVSVRSTGPKA